MLEVVFGTLAAIMPASRAWPQFVRIVLRKDVEGVSIFAWSLVLSNFALWGTYGALVDLPVLIIANIAAGLGAFGVLFSIARHGRTYIWLAPVIVGGSIAFALAVDSSLSSNAVLSIAAALSICMFLPQVYTVFKTEPTGVSPLTWWLGIFSGAVWLTYAILVDHPWIAAPHAIMVPCAIAILARLYTFTPSKVPAAP